MADPNSPVTRFQVWRAALPPALRLLLTVNVATYLAFVALSIVGQAGLMLWLALPADLAGLATRPWTPLTYGWTNLDAGLWGLVAFGFGAYWLAWLGRDVEETYGSHRLFALYVLAMLGGALLAVALGAAGGAVRPFYWGIWGPALAVLCALAVWQPDRSVALFLLGVIPLKWIAIVLVVLEVAFSRDLSHLGAAGTGALVAFAQPRGLDLTAWARPLFERRRAASRTAGRAAARTVGRPTPAGRAAGPAPLSLDRILDKIHAGGMKSLTEEERRFLEREAGRG